MTLFDDIERLWKEKQVNAMIASVQHEISNNQNTLEKKSSQKYGNTGFAVNFDGIKGASITDDIFRGIPSFRYPSPSGRIN